MIPTWLTELSIAYLGLGASCAVVILADELRHPQHMWITNVVWPTTALFGSAWIVWQYFKYGRLAAHAQIHGAMQRREEPPNRRLTPFLVMVADATLPCGSGCMLGDLCAEWLVFAFPGIAVAFGYRILFTERLFAIWIFDYLLAYGFGILFQYFTIAPMRGLPLYRGLIAAIKADILSLTARQVGMYGFMALAYFWVFQTLLGTRLHTDSAEFWFMMQLAILSGFLTSYPANWWLLKSGLKEQM